MATINSREMVDEIIAANGEGDGETVLKIVQYNNIFNGGLAYGLVFKEDGPANYMRYERGGACLNPVVIFERPA